MIFVSSQPSRGGLGFASLRRLTCPQSVWRKSSTTIIKILFGQSQTSIGPSDHMSGRPRFPLSAKQPADGSAETRNDILLFFRAISIRPYSLARILIYSSTHRLIYSSAQWLHCLTAQLLTCLSAY